MKKFIRKLTAVLLSLSIISATFSVAACNGIDLFSFDAYAEESGGYIYTVQNEEAIITGTDGTLSGDVVIPDTLGGYPVVTISDDAFAGCENITSIDIPDCIKAISYDAFKGCTNLAEITVAPEHTLLYIENGALCTDNIVICLPPKSGVKEFDVGNRIIWGYAFAGCEDLEYIYMNEYSNLGDSGEWVGTTPSLKAYVVDEANPSCSSDENGALYDKDKTWLISYPPKTEETEITVPDTVVGMHIMAFSGEYNAVLNISASLSDFFYEGKEILLLYSAFKGFSVSASDTNYAVEDGVLYSADKTTLMKYPIGNEQRFFEMPESVTSIWHEAFISIDYSSVLLKDINDADNYNRLFLRPDHLTVHAPCRMFLASDEIESHTLGLMGIKEVCLNIKEVYNNGEITEENEKAYIDGVNSICLSGLDKSALEVPKESLEAILFEAVKCGGHNNTDTPEEPDVPDEPDVPSEPQISYIEFETFPEKSDYVLFEPVNVDGAVLRVVYDNGDVEYVTEGFTFSPSMFKTIGNNYVTLYYKGFETGYETYVTKGPPKSISIKTLPQKTEYFVGEVFDSWNMSIIAEYADGSTETVYSGFEIYCDEFKAAGTYMVTVEYEGCQTTFGVTVKEVAYDLYGIFINNYPNKLQYIVGETLDTTGLVIEAVYDVPYPNYYSEQLTDGFEVYCEEFNDAGTYTVVIEYNGCYTSFDVEVEYDKLDGMAICNYPKKLRYTVGESLDTTGLELELYYPNDFSRTVTDGFEVECDLSTSGTKTATVSYTENGVTVTAVYTVEVKEAVESARVWASDISVSSGETVSIPVNISKNSGFMGFSIVLEYDETVFNPVSVTAGEMLGNGSLTDSIGGNMPDGQLKIAYYSDQNISADGIMFYVDFAVAENTVGDYDMNISYIQKDTFDENFENVYLNCEKLKVSLMIPDDGKVRFYSDSVTVNAGDELIVPVYASNAEGLSEFVLTLTYNDEILSYKEVQSDFISEIIDNENGTLTLKCSGASINTDELLIGNIVFEVAEYIETQETIGVSCDSAVVNNISAETVCTEVKVTINNPYADEPAFIYTEKSISITDGYIDIPVYINNNHGIMGFGMNISYDSSVLEPVSVTKGNALSSGSFDNNAGNKQGNFKVVWSNSEDVTDNGLLFTLRFKILDEQNMKSVPVVISYSQPDTFNENWEDVVLDIRIDTIEIERVYIAQFVADGVIVSTQEFTAETEKLVEPAIPYKAGYIARWEHYVIEEKDIVINAVYDLPVTVMISGRTITVDETIRLLPSCNYETTRKIWISSNPDVATVDNHGNVTAVGSGKCYITVKCYGEDSLGNEIESSCKTEIVVKEQLNAETLKEKFRAAFDEFFRVKLYDIMYNLRRIMVVLFRYAY